MLGGGREAIGRGAAAGVNLVTESVISLYTRVKEYKYPESKQWKSVVLDAYRVNYYINDVLQRLIWNASNVSW